MQPANKTATVRSISGGDPSADRKRVHSSRSSYRHTARIRRYRYLLLGLSVFFIVVYIFTWLHIARQSEKHEQLLLEFRKQEVMVNRLTGELETTRSELRTLVQERIPGLQPLRYDEAIDVNEQYIRNIIFTLVKTGKKQNYEYRLVMHNDTLSIIRPQVKILLFNDIGMQIGVAEVDNMNASSETVRSSLDPGEVRSYTSSIELIRDEEPSYFLLMVSETKQASADRLREHLGDMISP